MTTKDDKPLEIMSTQRASKFLRTELSRLTDQMQIHHSELRRLGSERQKIEAALAGLGESSYLQLGTAPGAVLFVNDMDPAETGEVEELAKRLVRK